jgi:hypothetical protein
LQFANPYINFKKSTKYIIFLIYIYIYNIGMAFLWHLYFSNSFWISNLLVTLNLRVKKLRRDLNGFVQPLWCPRGLNNGCLHEKNIFRRNVGS